jgi:hypothetical protein
MKITALRETREMGSEIEAHTDENSLKHFIIIAL